MSTMKWMNNLLLAENIFGVYRNYCTQNRTRKRFVILQLSVQFLFHTIILIANLILFCKSGAKSIIYNVFTTSAYAIAVTEAVTSIRYSHVFDTYLKNTSRISEYFKSYKSLINSLKRTHWFSIISIIVTFIFVVSTSAGAVLISSETNQLLLICILISHTGTRMVVGFQLLTIFVVINIIASLLKCLTSLISTVQNSVRSCDVCSDEQCDVTSEQIRGWVEMYRDLRNCCEQVTLCFGRKYFCTLSGSVLDYIFLSYLMFHKFILNEITDDGKKLAFVVCNFYYVFIVLLPIVAGQWAYNQGIEFHRAVTRLYNTMIKDPNEAETKLLKDFIRLIKKNPLEIKLISKIPAGVYMLPFLLMFAVNYVVIMLQFNHVI